MCEKLILKIKNRIKNIKTLRIRSNLRLLMSAYTCVFLVIPVIFGLISLQNNMKQQKLFKITEIQQELFNIVKGGTGNNYRDLIRAIDESLLKGQGTLCLINKDGSVVYEKNPSIAGENISYVNSTEESGLQEVNHYIVFYKGVPGEEYTLYYALPNHYFFQNAIGILAFGSISIILTCFLYVIIMFSFKKRVYKPIVTVENVIHGLVSGRTDLVMARVKEGDALYPLYQDLNIMMDTLEELILKESTAKLMKKQAELDALQSQINPHFLYNTLESIRGQAIVYGLKDIETMVHALSNLFRYSISNQESLVPLSEEFKNIENYLMIQQYRFNNKFIILNMLEEDTLNYCVPKFLIQPIVENAIQHGLETKIGKGTLTFKSYKTEQRLIINIQDDGLGIDYEKLVAINNVLVNRDNKDMLKKAGMNIGLANVNERIKLSFGNDYGLRIYSTQNIGTNVEIILPLIT